MAKDMTAKSSISSSLVLLLHCPQPFPVSIVEKRKKTYFLFLVWAPALQSAAARGPAHTHRHTQTKHISCQVKAGSEEATAPDRIQSDWAPKSTNKVMLFLSRWHASCNWRVCWLVWGFSCQFIVIGSVHGLGSGVDSKENVRRNLVMYFKLTYLLITAWSPLHSGNCFLLVSSTQYYNNDSHQISCSWPVLLCKYFANI